LSDQFLWAEYFFGKNSPTSKKQIIKKPVSGFRLLSRDVLELTAMTNEMQRRVENPALMAADFERSFTDTDRQELHHAQCRRNRGEVRN